MVTTHPFCANNGLSAKAKTDYRLRKTGAPFRLGIRPSPTVVGRVGALQCFLNVPLRVRPFFYPKKFVMLIASYDKKEHDHERINLPQ